MIIEVDRWLYQVLNPILPGRVFGHVIPADAPLPAVVFVYRSGPVTAGVGGVPILARAVYTVKVIGQTTSFEDLAGIFASVDTALRSAPATPKIAGAVKERYVEYVEFIGTQELRHLGADYVIYLSEVS